MHKTAISFTSQGHSLDGVLSLPEELPKPYPALLVCHPHPALGGNMDNGVVTAICRAAEGRGLATLRFNFRGVGKSGGAFSNGPEEQRDLAAALDVLRRWPAIDRKRVALAGYSFGASVILSGLRHCKAARCFVLISPPISSVRKSPIVNDRRPKLFLVGRPGPRGPLYRVATGPGRNTPTGPVRAGPERYPSTRHT